MQGEGDETALLAERDARFAHDGEHALAGAVLHITAVGYEDLTDVPLPNAAELAHNLHVRFQQAMLTSASYWHGCLPSSIIVYECDLGRIRHSAPVGRPYTR